MKDMSKHYYRSFRARPKIADLNTKLFLEQVTYVPDGSGGYIKQWHEVGCVFWGNIRVLNTTHEEISAFKKGHILKAVVTIRASSIAQISGQANFRELYRLKDERFIYSIQNILELTPGFWILDARIIASLL